MSTASNSGQDEAANGTTVEGIQTALSRILNVTGQDYGFSSMQSGTSAAAGDKLESLGEQQPHN
jgi:hypothetical protein